MHIKKIVKSTVGIKDHRILKVVGYIEVRPLSLAMATWSRLLPRVTAEDEEHFKQQ